MELSPWLKGGPFLEVSFLWELTGDRKLAIQSLIHQLPGYICIADSNTDKLIEAFGSGYPYDPEDSHSPIIHSLEFRLMADIAETRLALLYVEQLSDNMLLVDFRFFGSRSDAPEWNQTGVKNEDLTAFTDFLVDLYSIFKFKAGGIAIDQDIRELFDCEETSSSPCYHFENSSPDSFIKRQMDFLALIWNEWQSPAFPYKRIGEAGMLMILSEGYSKF